MTAVAPRTRLLLEGPIAPTLLRMALPNVLVMVAQAGAGQGPVHAICGGRVARRNPARERAQSDATRRYAPCPHVNAGGGARLNWRPIERVRAPGNGVNRP
jgi:hypothetical protein